MASSIVVTDLIYYPIKSCKGHSVKELALDNIRGFRNDRLFMIVDANATPWNFTSQRRLPRMSLIEPSIIDHDTSLSIEAPGMNPIKLQIKTVPSADKSDEHTATIWGGKVQVVDQGEEAAEWLSKFLESSVRLVRISDQFKRPIEKGFIDNQDDNKHHVSLADGYPILITAEESLRDLNEHIAAKEKDLDESKKTKPILMNRFRPNIVVKGLAKPWDEDHWVRIKIGSTDFQACKPCGRCKLPNIDQSSGIAGSEPSSTLREYRLIGSDMIFGQNLVPESTGIVVHVNDSVAVIKSK